jgi:DNA-binding response OmpR family regulator
VRTRDLAVKETVGRVRAGRCPLGPVRLPLAEDDPSERRLLKTALETWGYDVITMTDGLATWQGCAGRAPAAILDWRMPELDGLEVCRRVRRAGAALPSYLRLLTGRGRREDVVAGLEARADDSLSKPFDTAELGRAWRWMRAERSPKSGWGLIGCIPRRWATTLRRKTTAPQPGRRPSVVVGDGSSLGW